MAEHQNCNCGCIPLIIECAVLGDTYFEFENMYEYMSEEEHENLLQEAQSNESGESFRDFGQPFWIKRYNNSFAVGLFGSPDLLLDSATNTIFKAIIISQDGNAPVEHEFFQIEHNPESKNLTFAYIQVEDFAQGEQLAA